jgi:hypothetical protein
LNGLPAGGGNALCRDTSFAGLMGAFAVRLLSARAD